MKAITVHQPYASLIVEGRKRFETRSWAYSRKLDGQRVAIHAASLLNRKVKDDFHREYFGYPIARNDWWKKSYGAVVGTAILDRCGQVVVVENVDESGVLEIRWRATAGRGAATEIIPKSECRHGDFSRGRWIWELALAQLMTPVHVRGWQGFWNWEGQESATPP